MTILNTAVDRNLLLQKPDGYLNMYLGFAKAWFFKYVRTLDSGVFHRLSLFAFVSKFKMNM